MKIKDIKKWELDPKKKYVLFIPSDSLSREGLRFLSEALLDEGITGIVVSVMSTEGIKVIEKE